MKSALIVEADPADRLMLLRALGRQGWWVDVVGSVECALLYLNRAPLRVVLIDWEIADGSGLALLTAIKDHPAWGKTPVVMLHDYAEADEIERAFELGANDFLSKPFSGEAAVKKLERWVFDRTDSTESLCRWT